MSGMRDLLDAFVASAPDDAAIGLAALDTTEAAELLADLEPDVAARLVQQMSLGAAARCLAAVPTDAAARICRAMPVEILATLLRRLGDAAHGLIDALGPDLGGSLGRLLSYPEGTAGSAMDPLATAVQASAPAGDVRAQMRREGSRITDYLYAVDEDHVLVGVVDVASLMDADAHAPVSSVTRPGIDWVRVETPLDAVEAHPGWQRFDVMPVVDGGQRLVGIVRHRRLRQIARDGGVTRDDRAVRTLVALGEVYWLGLSGLLQGLAAAATAPQGADTRGEAR